jgi:cyclophilin family peptidyl-prolyl cis-trans isomerase/protein-disulfide isomerase
MTSTRNLFFYFLLSFMLVACAGQANAPAGSDSGSTSVAAIPTQFSLGKCVDTRPPTPDPNEKSLFPRVNTQDHILGAAKAYVTVLVYSDFQCAACAKLAPLLKSFVEKYPQDVRVVFRNFPLETLHDKAALSAQAAEAASIQGKFWEMHDLLFAKQTEWQAQKPADFQKWIIQQSAALALDPALFESDLTSPAITSLVQKTWDDGQKIKLPGAPVILINGEIVKWQVNLLSQLESFVKLAMLPKRQFGNCPPVVISPIKHYTATLKTNRGDIIIKLFVDKAPNTVNNFVFLAQQGWFDNSPFHRVVPGFIAQTGDPTGTGLGGPGYFIPSEKNNILYDRAGMVGMANSGPDTNGSQFFITLAPSSQLNKDYPAFGEVVTGMDVLNRLTPHDPSDYTSTTPADMLISVTIEEK